MLAAGKHVVCEKPLALTSTESAELLELAEASGLVHCANYNIRFYPLCHEARARIRRGDLGQVWNAHGRYVQDWLHDRPTGTGGSIPRSGGSLRAVADIGTHWLDLTGWITGRRVEAVLADLVTVHEVRHVPTGPVETYRATRATSSASTGPCPPRTWRTSCSAYEDGSRGQLTISQVSAGRKNHLSFEIDGARGALAWDSDRSEELWLGHRDRPNELLLRDPALLDASARADQRPAGRARGRLHRHLQAALPRVYRAVEAGGMPAEPDFPTFADGHEEILLCDAIAASRGDRQLDGGEAMKLGFLTAAFPDLSLEEIAAWAAAEGFETLEVACWPGGGGERRRYAGVSHIDVDDYDAGQVRDVLDRHGLEISALAYYPNNLHPDDAHRAEVNGHLRKVIDTAAALGVPDRRHLRRQRQGPAARRESRAVPRDLAGARRPRDLAGRPGRDRELPDDLQLGRVAGRDQPRVVAGDLGGDVRGDPRSEASA